MFPNGKVIIPDEKYRSDFTVRETESAIKYIKDTFQNNFALEMNLKRVSAPIAVLQNTGMNDYLSGWEKPVSFNIASINENNHAEIVHSLAKWKRNALKEYGFISGEGLYTDMNALRPDEPFLDNLHSVYVDQWDWERIIAENERTLDVLIYIVKKIYTVIMKIEQEVCNKYAKLAAPFLPHDIFFIHSEELEEMYPQFSPRERENKICQEKGAVFIIGIGANLENGQPHDARATDYDDWITETGRGKRGLNGDILVWNPVLGQAFELSSMGIRVNKESLLRQLELKNEMHKTKQYFHQRLIQGELPQSIGGGIGQSRLCMFYLRKAHIGEVQASIWPKEMLEICQEHHIKIL
ncbi:MAG: aspartate--ammonia ligase [Candidatus Marinimicrobia bacterium]|nr:aspartate--ammonia ligase [Candidatus Neomarinimicrobiota bacterium]